MLIKTHLALTVLAILIFISSVEHKFIFVIVALVAAYIPDVDSPFSKLGHHKIFRPLQIFVKHRGILHSFTFLLLFTLALVLFFPIAAFGFFLGYGLHLFADSFTINGIRPFYPSKRTASGKLKTGSVIETGIFIGVILAILFIIGFKFNIF